MGRAILLVVILISTVYAGIIINVQKEMYKLPDVLVSNFLGKESENVSDFALRFAVKKAADLGLTDATINGYYDTTVHFNNTPYKIDHCIIDSIQYHFYENPETFKATTFVRGALQSKAVAYTSEIAFNFPPPQVPPDLFYPFNKQGQPNHGHDYELVDESPNNNDAFAIDKNTMGPLYSGGVKLKYTAGGQGIGLYPLTSNGKRTSLRFDGYPSCTDGLVCENNTYLKLDHDFTISVFANIDVGSTVGCLYWMASERAYASPLHLKPTAGIWYTTGKMNFGACLASGDSLQIQVPFTADGAFHHYVLSVSSIPWFFGQYKGVIKAYKDGVLMQTRYSGPQASALAYANNFGITWAVKNIMYDGSHNAAIEIERQWLKGYLDNVTLFKRVLTPAEIQLIFLQATLPDVSVSYIYDGNLNKGQ